MTRMQCVGWAFVVLSLAALFLTTPSPRAAGHVLAPGLIPVFGVAFCLGFLVAQAAAVWYCRSVRAGVAAALAAGVGLLLAWFGWSMDLWQGFEEYDISLARHLLIGASCVSGLVLGGGLAKPGVSGFEPPAVR